MMRRVPSPARRFLPAAFFIWLLAGCSALQIDVDVYKGPLANDEDVQVEQFAAMAVGAKPLLIELRDRLEWEDPDERRWGRRLPWYESGHVRCVGNKTKAGQCFQHSHAQRVNAILGLYEDKRQDPVVRQFLKEGTALVHEFNAAGESIRVLSTDPNWENEFRETLIEKLKKLKAEKNKLMTGPPPVCSEDAPKFDKEPTLQALVKEYQELVKEHKTLLGNEGKSAEKHQASEDIFEPAYVCFLVKSDEDLKKASRATYELIELALEALIALPKTDISEAAQIEIRDGIAELLTTIIQPRNLSAVLAAYPDAGISENLRSRIESDKEIGFPSNTEIKTNLWQLKFCGSSGRSDVNECKTYDHRIDDKNTWKWKEKQYLQANRELARAINRYPVEMANELLEVHRFLASDEFTELADCSIISTAYFCGQSGSRRIVTDGEAQPMSRNKEEYWAYGLARFPIKDPDFDLEKGEPFRFEIYRQDLKGEAIVRVVGKIQGPPDLGFERGRLDDGIYTLIEKYLNAADAGRCRGEWGECERDRMLDALVRFSEKMLVIANYDVLLRDDDDDTDRRDYRKTQRGPSLTTERTQRFNAPGTVTQTFHRFGQSADGDSVDQYYSKTRSARRADGDKLVDYIRVLQAVGNTILIQADELRRRSKYKSKQADSFDREQWALAAHFSPPKLDEALRRLVKSLGSDSEKKAEEIKTHTTAIGTLVKDAKTRLEEIEKLRNIVIAANYLEAKNGQNPPENHEELKIACEAVTRRCNCSEVDGVGAVEKMLKWLKAEEIKNGTRKENDPRLKKIKATLVFFEEELEKQPNMFTGIPAQAPEETCAAVAKRLALKRDSSTDLEDAEKELAKQIVEKATRESKKSKLEKEKANLDAAVLFVVTEWGPVLDEVKEFAKLASIPSVFTALARRLRSKIAQTKGEKKEEKEKLEGALAALTDGRTNTVITALMKEEGAPETLADILTRGRKEACAAQQAGNAPCDLPSGRDALDLLISSLQYERIRVTQETGADSGAVQRINEALAAAYQYRAGMAFLRPAAAWLRSSFPATTLQAESGAVGWTNILGQQAKRTIPFYTKFTRDEEDRVNREIDKQFWQTINRVRVAGVGRTNYVVAKDDIGNWYVKRYQKDDRKITATATNLAMFGLGGAMNVDFFDPRFSETKGLSGAGPLGNLFVRYQSKYDQSVKDDLAALKKLSTDKAFLELVGKTAGKKKSDGKTFDEALKKYEKGLKDMKTALDKKPDDSDTLLFGLIALAEATGTLQTEILNAAAAARNDAADTSDSAAKVKAGNVWTVVGARLQGMLDRRKAANKSFSQAATFMGEAVAERTGNPLEDDDDKAPAK